ncbi:MAG: D-2-hydroxyacid dehydrogenase [Helicobacter sp.]|nr:D-2-hydroxyacid dehydrogenase [Helicobacter sp.]
MQEKIVFLDALTLGKNDLKNRIENLGIPYVEFPYTKQDEVIERAREASIVLTNKVMLNKEILEKLKNSLKLICITATGMNNVDLKAADELGILVKNVAGYSTQSVAQHTLMMALALSAKLPFYDNFCKSGAYEKSHIFTELTQPLHLISGKKWGIIGLGSIGKCVANLATAFGAEVSYHSTSGKNLAAQYPHKDLESLLKDSDIISIHAPLNPQTQNLLNAKNLRFLKDGAILINVGRGGIVNEADLSEVLQKREIYAGFDVFTQEPVVKNPLFNPSFKDKVILTPHHAWGYEESKVILIDGILKNIKDFLA